MLAGIGLMLGFTLFFTAGRFGQNTATYETYIRESVQGLDIGSQVRYRGVSIGRITQIALASAEYRRPEGEPFEDAFQLVVVRFQVRLDQLGMTPTVEDAVRLGLRVRLASQGITGVSYLEADFVSPQRFPALEVPWQPRFVYIPSVPSTVAQVQSAAETLLQRLGDADIGGMVANISALAANLRHETDDGDFATLLRDGAQLMRSLRGSVEGGDIAGGVAELRAAAAQARAAMVSVQQLVGGPDLRNTLADAARIAAELRVAAARLPQSIAALDATLRNARGATGDVQADLAPILRDLRSTIGNLRDTTESLRRSPSQAIFGAPPPLPESRR